MDRFIFDSETLITIRVLVMSFEVGNNIVYYQYEGEKRMAEPVLIALLFADKVIVEEKNKKKTIVGTFTRFYSDKFPVCFSPWYIYAAATNVSGEHSFSLNLVLEKEMQVVLPISGKLKVENPKNVIELVFPIGQAIFPTPGEYALTFNIDGAQVGSRILEVVQPEQGSVEQKIQ